ncbi:MAG TPA: lysyl oxidase family protein [Kofleriaceae bacterium]|nr:lysyl oxidase family protein [Kofleriaceae bacterium]
MRGIVVFIALAVTACGDNHAASDATVVAMHDAPIDVGDGPPGLPDIQFAASEMSTMVITNDIFTADDCEIAEACVGGTGERRLLRFDTVTPNYGDGDLVLGAPPPPGQSNDIFVWSPCHMHHHVANYATFELLDGSDVIVAGHKQGFCLEDTEEERPGNASRGYSCKYQGISVGWADVYSKYLPCQWIDVTGVPSGTYTLHLIVNPLQVFPETDYTNNEFSMQVSI